MNLRLTVLAVVILFVVGCSEPAKEQPKAAVSAPPAEQKPVLVGIFPVETVVKQKFNAQPDGSSALGAAVKNTSKAAVIVFGTRTLETVYGPDFISATVPPELFSTAGTVPVFIRDGSAESNRLNFVVKPK